MKRYIVTGTPGAGKTAIIRELAIRGYPVVEEAATDVIADLHAQGAEQPWSDPGFTGRIVTVQRQRQEKHPTPDAAVQFFDRSPICTLALAHYLGHPVTDVLAAEVERVVRDRVYQQRVFFVRPLGFVTPTAARRITLEESMEFERVHEQVYRTHGYDLVDIPNGDVTDRASMVDRYVRSWSG
jgi:predicted ATPase